MMYIVKSTRKSSSMVFLEHEKKNNDHVNSTSMYVPNKHDEDDANNDVLSSTLTSENEYQNQQLTSQQSTVGIKSVKEHAKKLNRLSTEFKNFADGPNRNNVARQPQPTIAESVHSRNYVRVVPKNLEIESFNFSDVNFF
jgi:hypothetical protein